VPVDTKIIAMTAQVLPEEKESLLKGGFDALLLKPFVEADLPAVLNKNVELKTGVKRLDIRTLAQMLDDKQQLNAILKQCYEDTSDDIVELSKAVENDDTDTTSLIIHRLAGRTGQVGEKNLAKMLRQLETAIRRQSNLSGLKKEMKEILSQTTVFLQLLQLEMEATSEVQQ
jgi:HPt (histidine-containing phosphotransfer) domain-containing protein